VSLLPARPPSPFAGGLPQLLPGEAAWCLSPCPIRRRVTRRAAAISSSLARSERKERACAVLGSWHWRLRSRRKRAAFCPSGDAPDGAQRRCSPGSRSARPGFALGSRSRALLGEIILPAKGGRVVSRHHVSPTASCRGQQSPWHL